MFFVNPRGVTDPTEKHLESCGSPCSDFHGVTSPRKGNSNRSWSLTRSPQNIWKASSAGSGLALATFIFIAFKGNIGRVRRWRRRWRVELISWKDRSQVRAALVAAASALLQRDRLVSRGQRHAGRLHHGRVLPVESFISKTAHQSTHWNARPLPLLPQWLLSDSCSWQVLWLWYNIGADGRLTFNHFVRTAAMLGKHLTSDLGQWWALAAPERG